MGDRGRRSKDFDCGSLQRVEFAYRKAHLQDQNIQNLLNSSISDQLSSCLKCFLGCEMLLTRKLTAVFQIAAKVNKVANPTGPTLPFGEKSDVSYLRHIYQATP